METYRVYVGELPLDVTMAVRVKVFASLTDDGRLWLHRVRSDNPSKVDNPVTIVTREGLLRLACGPFEAGLVEDHL